MPDSQNLLDFETPLPHKPLKIMKTKARALVGIAFLFVAGAIALLLPSCHFCPSAGEICAEIEQLPITPATNQTSNTVLEDAGTIKVIHGSQSGHVDHSAWMKMEQTMPIPAYADKAAVFLNGWKLGYSDGDHHVAGMSAAVGRISVQPGKISWQAFCALADDGGDKPIDCTYYFTVVAWNSTNLHAFVDQDDSSQFCKGGKTPGSSDNFFYESNTGFATALAWFTSFLTNPNFSSGRTVAILPRGFGFNFNGCPSGDHHLLQVACNFDHAETVIQNGNYAKGEGTLHPLPSPPNGRIDSGFVSWNTATIFKDNDTRRDYLFGEFVSGLGGPDVDVVDPPFYIVPVDPTGIISTGCIPSPAGPQTEKITVDNIPYTYAIPMLTGWNFQYPCRDNHVREIGTWIDEFKYDKLPTANGTLTYTITSILHDDSNNGGLCSNKVSILGLRRTAGAGVK